MTRTEALQRGHTTDTNEPIAIYVLGPAAHPADDVIGNYGSTAICASVGLDYAFTSWPIVVKVKPSMSRAHLVAHLVDLAAAIENHAIFIEPEAITRFDSQDRSGFWSIAKRDGDSQSEATS